MCLTIERICGSPSLAGNTPSGVKLSPDGTRATYLAGREGDKDFKDLWEMSVATQEHRRLVNADDLSLGELSDEEKARRERMRRGAEKGIMGYFWSEDSASIIIPTSDRLYQFVVATELLSPLRNIGAGDMTDPQLSPRGTFITFIRQQNVFTYKIATEEVCQWTYDGEGAIKNGMAEFVAQEEMDRMTGFWWSPDEHFLAFTRTDESQVDLLTRSEIYADEIKTTEQRYPVAGAKNALIKLGVVNIQKAPEKNGCHIRWVDLGADENIYLPRVKWFSAEVLSFQWQNRTQQQLDLRVVSVSEASFTSGQLAVRTIVQERCDGFVNLTADSDLHCCKNGLDFIWKSERSGFNHLYVGRLDQPELRPLTSGAWQVDGLQFVDEKKCWIYFTGRKTSVLERHLYRVNFHVDNAGRVETLANATCEDLTPESGWHSVSFSRFSETPLFLHAFTSPQQPPRMRVVIVDDAPRHVAWIEENDISAAQHPLHTYLPRIQTAPQFGTLQTNDGELHYRLMKPMDFDAEKRYPVVVYVYGGPHVQLCSKSYNWTASDMFFQFLLQQGYCVFTLDNRGSTGRGRDFEQAIFRKLSTAEVLDQQQGIEFLRSLPFVDKDNIGMYGHSYGGYMTLMCLFRMPPGYLKAGISGAPVTDWKYYDTHYTERYQGTPQDNPTGYENSSVFPYAKNYDDARCRLLMYHGMADDNVLFVNSTSLYKVLQDEGKQFDVMDYPGAKHGMSGEKVKVHLYKMIFSFLERMLK